MGDNIPIITGLNPYNIKSLNDDDIIKEKEAIIKRASHLLSLSNSKLLSMKILEGLDETLTKIVLQKAKEIKSNRMNQKLKIVEKFQSNDQL